jgi:threonine dehydrogenase-like Zn-dependent dehydrogenase
MSCVGGRVPRARLPRTTDLARVLIVGCGCRGRSLADALGEHAVRGTSRSPARLAELEKGGIEGVLADPDRLATLVPALAGVTVMCWLMGTAHGSPDVHGARLQTLLEHLVDTPVRGLVYEAAGSVDADLLERGASIVREASRTWHIPVEIVHTEPSSRAAWIEAMTNAVARLLSA